MSRIVSYRRYFLAVILVLSLTALSCSPLTMVTLGSRSVETPLEVATVAPLRQAQDSATVTSEPTPTTLPATALEVGLTEEELLINLYEP
jgi:hypothetical protein